ncbi:MAG: TIGR04283 family arsenosugar biosynthesis glycosyltransferase [Pseudomonadota bacterium]
MSMISVIIPTLNAEASLNRALASLLSANSQGIIREVIICDGGSTDRTHVLATEAGARLLVGAKGRGVQLKRGAAAARGDWLLFLHADTVLAPGWEAPAVEHMGSAFDRVAAIFRLRFSRRGFAPSLVAFGANLRSRVFRMPYGDQGLLISRAHYDRLSGYAPLPLFEDVDFIRRLVKDGGRSAVRMLPAVAITSAARYEKDGYARRVARNLRCVSLYFAGVSPHRILEIYNGQGRQTLVDRDGQAAPGGQGKDAP